MRLLAITLAVAASVCASCGCGGPSGTDRGVDGGTDGATDSSGGAASTDAASTDATGLLGLGELCTSDAQCLSGACLEILTPGAMHCTAFCDIGTPTCPEMGVCWVLGAAAGFCVRACDPTMDDCPGTLTCQGVIEPGCSP